MLLRSRFRRSRCNLLFACLLVSSAVMYAAWNLLPDASDRIEQQLQPRQRHTTSNVTANSSSRPGSSSQRPVSLPSLRIVTRPSIHETTASFARSPVVENNTTDDDGEADTDVEPTDKLVKRERDAEQRVRREVHRLRPRPPTSVRYSHGQWQIVDDKPLQVYVYSAFYDSRPDIDRPQVRIIAVAESDVHSYGFCCLLWYTSRRLPDVVETTVDQIGPQISPHGLTVLEQFIFSCRLDPGKTEPPASVSVVAPHDFRLSNLLPVQIPARPKRMIEFGHCMSILYWKQDPFRLVEWLEAHRLWGVGEVNIYTTMIDNVTDGILRRYADSGFVNYRKSPGPLGDDNEYAILLNMSPVINDCLYRNMYRYRYVVCTDVDELIVPASPHHNYSQMLHAAAAAATSRDNAVVHSYIFRNAYFFLDFGATDTEPWYLLTQRYTKRVQPSRRGYSAKSITRPLSCVGLQNHLCWRSLPSYNGQPNWNVDVSVDIGKNQHYKKCHFDKYLHRNGVCHRMMTNSDVTDDRTMFRFRDKLARVVAKKLLQLDLVEPTDNDSWKQLHPVP